MGFNKKDANNSCIIKSPKFDRRDLTFCGFNKGDVDLIPKGKLVEQLDKVVYGEPYVIGRPR